MVRRSRKGDGIHRHSGDGLGIVLEEVNHVVLWVGDVAERVDQNVVTTGFLADLEDMARPSDKRLCRCLWLSACAETPGTDVLDVLVQVPQVPVARAEADLDEPEQPMSRSSWDAFVVQVVDARPLEGGIGIHADQPFILVDAQRLAEVAKTAEAIVAHAAVGVLVADGTCRAGCERELRPSRLPGYASSPGTRKGRPAIRRRSYRCR